MSWVLLVVDRGGAVPAIEPVQAVVDSGADRTFLSRDVATRLGIGDELIPDPRGGIGIEGQPFRTWFSPVPIDAWVLTAIGTPLRVWGPRLRLDPVFSDAEIAVLGRADFFLAFTVTLQEHPATPVYHLDAA